MSVAMSSGANYNPRNSESHLSEMSDSMDDSESEVVSFLSLYFFQVLKFWKWLKTEFREIS